MRTRMSGGVRGRGLITPSYSIENNKFIIGASIGISLFPDDGEDARTLMKEADDAMYAVKRNGGNGWSFGGRGATKGR